jgi:hypothetical protein
LRRPAAEGASFCVKILRNPKPYKAPPADPWLEAMFDDVHERIRALMEARSEDEWRRDEDRVYMRLVRELAEISTAMHDARRRKP